MTGFVGCRIVRASVAVPVNDLAALIAAADEHRRIALTFIDGESTIAWPFYVERIDSLHRKPALCLPGGSLLDVRSLVILCLADAMRMYRMGENLCYAYLDTSTGCGLFLSRTVSRKVLFNCRPKHVHYQQQNPRGVMWSYDHPTWFRAGVPECVEPILRTFNEQLLSEQPAHA